MEAIDHPQPMQEQPVPASTSRRDQTERSLLIDIVKGLAIALVAIGHTNQGELSRHWWGTSLVGTHLNAFIYAFHMPAFFLVSGVFIRQSMRKRGLWGFVCQKSRTLLYPFLIWSILIPVATALLALFTPLHQQPLSAVLLNLVTGNSAWFLPALFVSLVLAALLQRISPALLFVLSYLAASFWRPWNILAIDRAIAYLPFVTAGAWLAPCLSHVHRLSARMSLIGAILLGIALYLVIGSVTTPATIRWGLLPAGFAGTAALLLAGRSLLAWRWVTQVAQVGLASLWVFLLAPFPQGFARAILVAAHCTHPWVQLLVPSAFAILLPTWLFQQRRRYYLNYLFTFPARTEHPSEPNRNVMPGEPSLE